MTPQAGPQFRLSLVARGTVTTGRRHLRAFLERLAENGVDVTTATVDPVDEPPRLGVVRRPT